MPLRGGGRRLMANTILNFHFDYRNPSLSETLVSNEKQHTVFHHINGQLQHTRLFTQKAGKSKKNMLLSEEAHMSCGALAVNISFHCNCAPNPPPAPLS